MTRSDPYAEEASLAKSASLIRFVLASASPRRRDLLAALGVEFEVRAGSVDETTALLDPGQVVLHLSLLKAQAVAAELTSDGRRQLVLGADTIVVLAGKILGKPASSAEAIAMLTSLSGQEHQVFTGITLLDSQGQTESVFCVSRVFFRALASAEIRYYVSTGEPMDKAGAYALQGIASAFVERIDGCYTNIIGLPMPSTISLLRRHGLEVLGLPPNTEGAR